MVEAVTLHVQGLSFDCRRPAEASRFWAAALGWRITEEQPDEVVLEAPLGSGYRVDILFRAVAAEKVSRNRLHLDLRPDDQAVEIARLEALGAQRVGVEQTSGRVLMADPEGNEFYVLRPLA